MEKEINSADLDAILKLVELSEADYKLGRSKSARELLAERRCKEKDGYEPDDAPLTLEQIQAIQKLADDMARAQGKTPPSEIPEENWQTLF